MCPFVMLSQISNHYDCNQNMLMAQVGESRAEEAQARYIVP